MNETNLPEGFDHLRQRPTEILSESKGILKDKELAERKNKSAFPKKDRPMIPKSNLNQMSHDDETYALTPLNRENGDLALNSS